MVKLYTTTQINIQKGEQLRITAGTRTIFVFRNDRGLFVKEGGYLSGRKAKKPK